MVFIVLCMVAIVLLSVVRINVSLQEGKTLDDELQKSIETYVYTVIDCEKVTVVEEKE